MEPKMTNEKQRIWPTAIWRQEAQPKEPVPKATCGTAGQGDPGARGAAGQVNVASWGWTDRQTTAAVLRPSLAQELQK